MPIYINRENNGLIIELKGGTEKEAALRYSNLISSLFYLLKNQKPETVITDVNEEIYTLLEDILPDEKQIEQLFTSPNQN